LSPTESKLNVEEGFDDKNTGSLGAEMLMIQGFFMFLNIGIAVILGTILSLLIAYFYVNRESLFSFWKYFSNEEVDWDKNFSRFVRQKVQDFGGPGQSKNNSTRNEKNESTKRSSNLEFYQMRLLSLESAGKQDCREYKNLLKIYQLFERQQKRDRDPFKKMSHNVFQKTSVRVTESAFMGTVGDLIALKTLEVSEGEDFKYSYESVENLVQSMTLMRIFVDDAQRNDSSISKWIEKKKNVKGSDVYRAIEFLILLKSGASEKGILKELVVAKYIAGKKLKSLMIGKKDRAILSLLRESPEKFKDIGALLSLIEGALKKLAEAQRCNKHQNREKKKSEKKSQKKAKKPINESKMNYYCRVLGVNPGDTLIEIKQSYRKLIMKKHPDRLMSKGLSERELSEAHEKFVEIQMAYEYIQELKSQKKSA